MMAVAGATAGDGHLEDGGASQVAAPVLLSLRPNVKGASS